MVLVDTAAFRVKYNSTCETYCRMGAAPAVSFPLFGLEGPGYGKLRSCPGDKGGKYLGSICECSLPDRPLESDRSGWELGPERRVRFRLFAGARACGPCARLPHRSLSRLRVHFVLSVVEVYR
ncbi:unnamed protein product [Effrenium voratum]|nr:unnamed protein product [Effrenium voratum]